MLITIDHFGRKYRTDLRKGIDLSSQLARPGGELKAWYVPDVEKKPVVTENWIGSVAKGSPVNFFDLKFNPHGNGTHTECVGHISPAHESVNGIPAPYCFIARLVHLKAEQRGSDRVITLASLKERVKKWNVEALIIKSGNYKPGHDFSNTNPTYFEPALLEFVREMGIEHFLTDLPSVDREEDGGQLLAHKAFWNYPRDIRKGATISELLLIPEAVNEGLYWLNLQVAPFENDASPSRPVIYPIEEIS